jgi:2-phosphosulfolactate phosphatase
VVTVFDQAGFDARLEWGVEGARVLAGACRVVVVVDVLSFTTAIEVAVGRGAVVFPHDLPDPEGSGEPQGGAPVDQGAAAFARRVGAELAGGRGAPSPGRFSLSPVSLLDIPPGTRLVLPSPNGSAVAAALADAGAVVLAGCLRNASAVARAARQAGGEVPVAVVAAGERRPDGTLRPAVEDLLGAGAVLHALGGRPSPEARAAVAAFRGCDLPHDLLECASGRELAALGHAADVHLAAGHDLSQVVPVLRGGAFTAVS